MKIVPFLLAKCPIQVEVPLSSYQNTMPGYLQGYLPHFLRLFLLKDDNLASENDYQDLLLSITCWKVN